MATAEGTHYLVAKEDFEKLAKVAFRLQPTNAAPKYRRQELCTNFIAAHPLITLKFEQPPQ
jgi:hypothetical protein